MKKFYWEKWKHELDLLGISPLACALFDHAGPLFPFFSQLMLIGMPLFKAIPFGEQYRQMITLLDDEESILQFKDFLQRTS